MKFKLKWNDRKLVRELQTYLQASMTKVSLFLVGQVKQNISRGNVTGLNPSKPGEFPKVQTGILRSSVGYDIVTKDGDVVSVIGVSKGPANQYAPLLESEGIKDGTVRPFLRPTVQQNIVKIMNILK